MDSNTLTACTLQYSSDDALIITQLVPSDNICEHGIGFSIDFGLRISSNRQCCFGDGELCCGKVNVIVVTSSQGSLIKSVASNILTACTLQYSGDDALIIIQLVPSDNICEHVICFYIDFGLRIISNR